MFTTILSGVFAAMEFLPLPIVALMICKINTPGGGSERLGDIGR
jgi:hypothetical protein